MEQQFFWGKSSIRELLPILRRYNPEQIFLVRGKRSYDSCGAREIMKEIFSNLRCEIVEFFNFEENPKIEDIERGLEALHKCSSPIILSIGGGSVLDMAKLIRFFHSFSGDPIGSKFIQERKLVPLISIPTTSGTGCEATHFAVLYKNKYKYSVAHDHILPDVAIVYPPFTYQNPTYLTACSGFDALAQAIEAYWNVNATQDSDVYAIKAIQLLWTNLPVVINSPSEEVRDKISEGAYWAGKAINITKTTAPHALSYPFTSYYNIPHGHGVALTFPFISRFNFSVSQENVHSFIPLQEIQKRLNDLAIMLDINDPKENIHSVLCNYIINLGLSFELPETYDRQIILNHVNIQRIANNPRVLSHDDLNSVLEQLEQFSLNNLRIIKN